MLVPHLKKQIFWSGLTLVNFSDCFCQRRNSPLQNMSNISWNRKIMLKFKRNFKEKKLTSSMMFDVYLIIVSWWCNTEEITIF